MMRMNSGISFFIVCIVLFFSRCTAKVVYYKIPSFSESGAVNAVIEIPAGTNMKYEYDNTSKAFVIDQENGRDRSINFLSYPANYGFIPSTLSNVSKGGDGDALDILVLAESQETGTIMEVQPVAMLKMLDKGEQDYKIIAVPINSEERIVDVMTYEELRKNNLAILEIIELWFLNYNKKDAAIVEGWGDEKEALNEIKRAVKK